MRSRDELEWLQSGSGPLRNAFTRLGVPTTVSRPSIDEVIAWLGTRQRSLLVHGNYLTDEQIRESGAKLIDLGRLLSTYASTFWA